MRRYASDRYCPLCGDPDCRCAPCDECTTMTLEPGLCGRCEDRHAETERLTA